MYSALRRDFLREIARTKGRFFSIFILVALSVAFLSGLRSTAPDMKLTGDHYLDSLYAADLQILSTLGLTGEDLDALLARPEIEDGEAAWVIDAFAASQSIEVVSKVYSLPEKNVNNVLLLRGRMPERADECVVEDNVLGLMDIALGDTLTLTPGASMADALRYSEYTVVGTVRSPIYISIEHGSASIGSGSVRAFLYLPREAFTLDYYTAIFLRAAGAGEMTAFYDEYDDYISEVQDALEPLGEARVQARYDALVDTAEAALDDARRELDAARAEAEAELGAAEAELADARAQLDDGWAELEAGRAALAAEAANGWAQLDGARTRLAEALQTLNEGEEAYAAGLAQYENGRADYESGLAQYESGLAQYEAGKAAYESAKQEYETKLTAYQTSLSVYQTSLRFYELAGLPIPEELLAAGEQLEEAERQLAAAEQQLDAAERRLAASERELAEAKAVLDAAEELLAVSPEQLAESRARLDAGWQEYRDGLAQAAAGEWELRQRTAEAERQLAGAEAELRSGEEEYAAGFAEYSAAKADAEAQLAEAEEEWRAARRQIAELEHGEWYILSRSYNPGYTGFGQDADRMGNLAGVFPLIFFLVAALVCLTTMTRMVEEQRVQIGSLKALGYSRLAISMKYIGYGLLPSVTGGVVGLVVGCVLFPTMIFTAYQIMYQVPNLELRLYPEISVFSVAAAVACTTLATLWACLATLRETPAALMRPRSPKAGKRVLLEHIRPLWRHMKFLHKVTARNLFRYQKRFWMTVIGIGGCTALIIAGFGIRFSLTFTMSRQFDDLFLYTAQMTLSGSLLPEDRQAVEDALENDARVVCAVGGNVASASAVTGRNTVTVYRETLSAEDAPRVLALYDYRSGEPMSLTDDGVYIDQKLSELLGAGVGDTILLDGDGRVSATVAGIFEHYTAHFVYMTPAYFEQLYGRAPEINAYAMIFADDSAAFCDEVFEDMMRLEGVTALQRMKDTKDTYTRSMERIDFVVVIIILSAAALALVVLYNLSNINITERLRELATIKLLGFYDREVSAYVYRENVVLTVLGIAAGVLLGHWFHMWLVRQVEIDLMMFGRDTDPRSYLYAALLTALFSFLVNLAAHFKLKKIDMVESLKSAE